VPGPIELAALASAGVVAGVWLLIRGFGSYREAARIGDTATSRVATLAIGEVRVSGVVEPAELSLVSPLQSAACVFYRSQVSESSSEGGADELFREERAVGFRVRDATGSIRVFPRGASFDVPDRWTESTGMWGETPDGLQPRSGGAFAVGQPSREAQIAALLTVRQPEPSTLALDGAGSGFGGGLTLLGGERSRTRRYREARLEPGDVVTVVGQVLPFDQLPDPASADLGGDRLEPLGALRDPEIAADLAEARANGELAATPQEAWGNAAIPGFGIGRPVVAPELDPAASAPPLASPEEAAAAERTFEIEPHDLVLAAAPEAPLVIAFGAPDQAVARHEQRFLVGLLGAVLAIGSAVVLAVAVVDVPPL
jgi:hypothetical protein